MKDTCPIAGFKDVNLFIPSSVGTIQENGLRVKAVHAANLTNGFELISQDSLIKIVHFHLVFDNRADGNLYSKISKGNKIMDNAKHLFSLSKIKDATLITIDDIMVKYKDICYRAKSQVYLY